MAVLLALLVAAAGYAVAPLSAADAATGSGRVSVYTPCGAYKSGVRGFISAGYDYNAAGNKTRWAITDRRTTVSSAECPPAGDHLVAIAEIRARTRIRFAGISITGCSVGAGVTCTGGASSRTVSSGWITRRKAHTVRHGLSSASFTAAITHSAENIADGRFTSGSRTYDKWVSHYCAWGFTGSRPNCSRRT